MAWFKTQPVQQGTLVSFQLPVSFIEEDDSVIAYTPALDLSSAGKNKKEALVMFNEAVEIFFRDLLENNTAAEVLPALGWKRDNVRSAWMPPRISQESIGVKVPVLA